jgi:hypothetical protein
MEEQAGRDRWARREQRRRARQERLQKHGASLRRVYADAIRKRAKTAQARKGGNV